MTTLAEARKVKERVRSLLIDQDGIAGIGLARDMDGNWIVSVNVDPDKDADIRSLLPRSIDEVRIEVEAVSEIHFL
jgi:hypothetical protein